MTARSRNIRASSTATKSRPSPASGRPARFEIALQPFRLQESRARVRATLAERFILPGVLMSSQPALPRAILSVTDGAMMMIGIIIGIGIFKAPQVVAMFVTNEWMFVGVWVAGGIITLIGALVYAELAAAYPSTGGEYHFLTRALGHPVGFMFAWARTTVIQTGAIAAVAFVLGDYAQELYSIGSYGSSIYAGTALAILTCVNLAGTHESKSTQNILTFFEVLAMLSICLVGFTVGGGTDSATLAAA